MGDSTPNTIDVADTDTYISTPIVLDPNLILETRLINTGPIVNETDVTYELTIKNIGEGQYIDGGGNPLGIYFIVPEGATYQGVTDSDTGDQLNITSCGSLGNVNGYLPAFSGYDAELAGCQLVTASGFIPAGASYKMLFNMEANGPFSSGDTEVNAILVANDVDSILLQLEIFTPSTDPFEIVNDNFVLLGFDNTQLVATVNR